MAHSHSTQRFIPETFNRENLSYIHYIEFHDSLYNIYNVFRYSIDTKTLIPKTGIIFSKPLKIEKTTQKKFGGLAPSYTRCRTLCVTRGGIPTPPPWDPTRKVLGAHDTNIALLRGIVRRSCRIWHAHTHTCKEYNTYPT
jgi:hypothetical protein